MQILFTLNAFNVVGGLVAEQHDQDNFDSWQLRIKFLTQLWFCQFKLHIDLEVGQIVSASQVDDKGFIDGIKKELVAAIGSKAN